MDIKRETYYHLAVLAANNIWNIATPQSNKKLRDLLSKYGSFEGAYRGEGYALPNDIKSKLELAKRDIKESSLEYNLSRLTDNDFPAILKNNSTLAPIIYYRGNLQLACRDTVAVVGTRGEKNPDIEETRTDRLTDKQISFFLNKEEYAHAKKVLDYFSEQKYVVVSGLAEGCDTLGHESSLENGTIGVISNPLNKYYPSSNRGLQDKIAQSGLLVSQFPIGLARLQYGQNAFKANLVRRNITTVALSKIGVLVIKTADKGGTQHAIRSATELNVPLFALKTNFIPSNNWTKNFEWDYSNEYYNIFKYCKEHDSKVKSSNEKYKQMEFKQIK